MFYAFFLSTQNFSPHSLMSSLHRSTTRRDTVDKLKNSLEQGELHSSVEEWKKTWNEQRERIFIGIFFINCTRRESKARREERRREQIEDENQQNWVNRSRVERGQANVWLRSLCCTTEKRVWKAFYFFIYIFHMIKSIKIPLFLQIFTINFYMIFPSHTLPATLIRCHQ